MWRNSWPFLGLIALSCVALAPGARAEDCPGNPGALGTSRVLTIDPAEFPRIGTVQYSKSLPLQDKEVVLTFDDGPMPPYTNRVLEVLAEHCVRANYFIIGRMARGYPDLMRQIRASGHVIGTHSQNHPLAFERMPVNAIQGEVEQGIASVQTALNDRNGVAPFFRIPGLLRAPHVENYLQSRGLVAWSADVVGDDWKHIPASEVVRRSIARLEEKGKGILLLHDIQPATALALPELLRQLKAHGYKIVVVEPGKRGAPVPVAAVAKPQPVPPVATERTVLPPLPTAPATLTQSEPERPATPAAVGWTAPTVIERVVAPSAPPVGVERTTVSRAPVPAVAAERVVVPVAQPTVAEQAAVSPAPIAPAERIAVATPMAPAAVATPPRPATIVPARPAAPAPVQIPVEEDDEDAPPQRPSPRIVTIPQPIDPEPAPVQKVTRQATTEESPMREPARIPTPRDEVAEARASAAHAVPPPPAPPVPVRKAEPDPSIPRDPVRPYAAMLKPAQSASVPGKSISVEPGGLRNAVTVAVPRAGGVGASSIVRNPATDGRFQDNR
jgi:peptidoglycan/xylan/chitin deacetylase (PgdA/CDA1 family)